MFAREPGGQGPPLAAKRLTGAAIGTQIRLSSADSMMPGRALVKGQTVSITARVSFSGRPVPSAGDLYGELSYDVGRDGVRELVIDRVAELPSQDVLGSRMHDDDYRRSTTPARETWLTPRPRQSVDA